LGLRLAANISAGHLLLAIIGGFGWDMLKAGGAIMIGSVVPIALIWALMFLEIAVAGIQAYVLTLLTTIYLNDAENLH
jgi:F0F1-type ATP synthase membrane subunit a